MKKKHLSLSIALSFLTHILIFGVFAFIAFFASKEVYFLEMGGGKGTVWIDLESSGSGSPTDLKNKNNSSVSSSEVLSNKNSSHPKDKNKKNNNAVLVRQKIEGPKTDSSQNNISQGLENGSTSSADGKSGAENGQGASPQGLGTGSGKGTGEGNANLAPSILGIIRRKIEKAKHYPILARARKMEGVAVLSFSIKASGDVESLLLVKSSGAQILDEEALATVKRAAPLPYYSLPIRISIKFSLE